MANKLEIYKLTFNYVQVNSYVVEDTTTREAAIIDCGCMDEHEFALLQKCITQNNIQPRLLLATHLHFDHIWGIPYAVQKWGLTPIAHSEEIAKMPPFDLQMRQFAMPSDPERKEVSFASLSSSAPLYLGSHAIESILIPGHTPGHVAYYMPQDGVLFSGDILFAGGDIGRTDLPGGSYSQLVNGIKEHLWTLPDETIVYPGHGPITTIGQERISNRYIS